MSNITERITNTLTSAKDTVVEKTQQLGESIGLMGPRDTPSDLAQETPDDATKETTTTKDVPTPPETGESKDKTVKPTDATPEVISSVSSNEDVDTTTKGATDDRGNLPEVPLDNDKLARDDIAVKEDTKTDKTTGSLADQEPAEDAFIESPSQVGTLQATDNTRRVLQVGDAEEEAQLLGEPNEGAQFNFEGFKAEGRPIIEDVPLRGDVDVEEPRKDMISEKPKVPEGQSLYDQAKEKGQVGEAEDKPPGQSDISEVAKGLNKQGEIPLTQVPVSEATQ